MRRSSSAPRRAAPASQPTSRRAPLLVGITVTVLTAVVVTGLVFGPRQPLDQSDRPIIAVATSSRTPSPPPAPSTRVLLDDTTFPAPAGWTVSTSTLPDSGDTVAHLSHASSGTRLQAATLAQPREPVAACEALATGFSERFTDVTWNLGLPVAVDASLGGAATCGFRGSTPLGDRVEVTFTLVQRTVDGHSLLWRSVVDDEGASGSSVAEASAMACSASRGFGVPLPLC